jgi:hypothetical protein
MNIKIHPCKCTDYNGGQCYCYNCLNGFHRGRAKKCKTKNAKVMGVMIVVRSSAKKKKGSR